MATNEPDQTSPGMKKWLMLSDGALNKLVEVTEIATARGELEEPELLELLKRVQDRESYPVDIAFEAVDQARGVIEALQKDPRDEDANRRYILTQLGLQTGMLVSMMHLVMELETLNEGRVVALPTQMPSFPIMPPEGRA